ncbi:MAG: universal stress protein [Calditrichaeota bacterium]|nr:MAG: universal stress protein [Calditrichota bacterium]
MWSPHKILVPTDFSRDANRALYYAEFLSAPYESEIILLHVISLFEHDPNNPEHTFPNAEEVYQTLEAAAASQLERLHHDHRHLRLRKETVRGISPAEEILNFAAREGVDLIVMGTHGRSGLSHFLLGSVAEKVIRHMQCPVITIRYTHGNGSLPSRLKRVVVPLDFSAYSRQALNHAVALAQQHGAALALLHVIEERVHPAYYVTGDVSLFKLLPDLRERSIDAMKEFVEKEIPSGVEHTFHVREGKAHQEIVNFAEEQDADLIAIATHGLSGLDYLLLGSTTEKVVRKAKTPVLAVRAEMK